MTLVILILILMLIFIVFDGETLLLLATGMLIFIMLIALDSCKTNREVQKNSSRVDSTTENSKQLAKATSILQNVKNARLDNSYTKGQNTYQKQTLSLQFALVDSNGKKGNGLENRLIGITETTETGTQSQQTGKTTQQNTDWTNTIKDSLTSGEKKSAVVNKVEAAKRTTATHKVGGSAWLLVLLLIAVVVLILWIKKVNPIALLIGWIRKKRKEDTPNTPA